MDNDEIEQTIDAVREARLAMLQVPGAARELYDAIKGIEDDASYVQVASQLYDDLAELERRGIYVLRP